MPADLRMPERFQGLVSEPLLRQVKGLLDGQLGCGLPAAHQGGNQPAEGETPAVSGFFISPPAWGSEEPRETPN